MSDHLQRHHKYWPRRDYKTRIEKTFRQLDCNIVMLSAAEHTRLHRRFNAIPGGKPSKQAMVDAIRKHTEGKCTCPPKEVQIPLF